MTQMTLFIFTESATHAGTGIGLGVVDLPIQREKTTGYPIIQGSGIKGALRSQYPGNDNETKDKDGNIIPKDADGLDKEVVFGPANEPDFAGALTVGDARVLAFPVRSLKGVFAWVTCVDVLARFKRDCDLSGVPDLPPERPMIVKTGETEEIEETEAFPSSGAIVIDPASIILEEYQYKAKWFKNENGSYWLSNWSDWLADNALLDDKGTLDDQGNPVAPGIYFSHYGNEFKKRFVILPDDDFRDFALYATQIVTRIGINRATKTVRTGALFTQELLPADTLLYSPITTTTPRAKSLTPTFDGENKTDKAIAKWLQEKSPNRIQIGGDETVGRGLVTLRWGTKS
jgi:CRISPR-associated protein Cmr4